MHDLRTLIALNEHPELAHRGCSPDVSLGYAKSRPKARKVKPVIVAPGADFEVTGGGTIYLLHPLTEQARQWVASS
jgi:hypothetical protein